MRQRTALLLLAAGVAAAFLAVALLPTSATTDAQRDWLSARAAVDGVSPYVPTVELADHYQPAWDHEWPLSGPHPRTPGAIVLSLPLLAVDFYQAADVVRVLSVFALAVVVWVAYRITGKPWTLAGLPVLAVSLPMFSAHHPANMGLVVAALVAVAYIAPPRARGVVLGVAAMLRLWPALIFLAYRDRGTWKSGVLTVAVVEAAGWVLIRPTITEVINGIFFGSGADAITRSGNASLWALPMLVAIPAVVAVVVAAGRSRKFLSITCAALLVSPLSWPAYHALLYPWLVKRPWLLTGWFVYPLFWNHLGLLAAVTVGAFLAGSRSDEIRSEHPMTIQGAPRVLPSDQFDVIAGRE